MADIGSRILPAHVESTVEAIAKLHAEHFERAPALQKLVAKLTARAARPSFVAWLTVVVLVWVGANLCLQFTGHKPFDGPPFNWLQGVIGLVALYMTLLILVTQRREDQLGSRREQLTLELAILSEQKSAKIIQLLEELRRDHPMLEDRVDHDASAMATPADPQAIFDAITEQHQAREEGKSLSPPTIWCYQLLIFGYVTTLLGPNTN